MLNYLPVFLYLIKIFFATGAKTLLFPQSKLPIVYQLFYGIIKVPEPVISKYFLKLLPIMI